MTLMCAEIREVRVRKIRIVKKRVRILACRDVYPIADVARHFHVSEEIVRRIWRSPRTTDVEPPNIKVRHIDKEILWADTKILLERGWNADEIAMHFRMQKGPIRVIVRELLAENPRLKNLRAEENQDRTIIGQRLWKEKKNS